MKASAVEIRRLTATLCAAAMKMEMERPMFLILRSLAAALSISTLLLVCAALEILDNTRLDWFSS